MSFPKSQLPQTSPFDDPLAAIKYNVVSVPKPASPQPTKAEAGGGAAAAGPKPGKPLSRAAMQAALIQESQEAGAAEPSGGSTAPVDHVGAGEAGGEPSESEKKSSTSSPFNPFSESTDVKPATPATPEVRVASSGKSATPEKPNPFRKSPSENAGASSPKSSNNKPNLHINIPAKEAPITTAKSKSPTNTTAKPLSPTNSSANATTSGTNSGTNPFLANPFEPEDNTGKQEKKSDIKKSDILSPAKSPLRERKASAHIDDIEDLFASAELMFSSVGSGKASKESASSAASSAAASSAAASAAASSASSSTSVVGGGSSAGSAAGSTAGSTGAIPAKGKGPQVFVMSPDKGNSPASASRTTSLDPFAQLEGGALPGQKMDANVVNANNESQTLLKSTEGNEVRGGDGEKKEAGGDQVKTGEANLIDL